MATETNFPRSERVRIFGLPGEEQNMLVIYKTDRKRLRPEDVSQPGKFQVQFLLCRPGYRKFADREPSFLDEAVGDSHIRAEQLDASGRPAELVLLTRGDGWDIKFTCVLNSIGNLGKIVADDIRATNWSEAEVIATRALTAFLSAWAVTLDVPIEIETLQVWDQTTNTRMLRIRAPHIESLPSAGFGRNLSEEFCQFASIYREALNANSPFYRFLCFYKLIESLYFFRSKQALAAKEAGKEPNRYSEDVPLTRDGMKGLLCYLYSEFAAWEGDEFILDQIVPDEAVGKRFKKIRAEHLESIRNALAHGLMRSGEVMAVADRAEHIQRTLRWTPLLRIWSRLLLKTTFPNEFEFGK